MKFDRPELIVAQRPEFLRCKHKGPARRILCKPLMGQVPEAGVEPKGPCYYGIGRIFRPLWRPM